MSEPLTVMWHGKDCPLDELPDEGLTVQIGFELERIPRLYQRMLQAQLEQKDLKVRHEALGKTFDEDMGTHKRSCQTLHALLAEKACRERKKKRKAKSSRGEQDD